ncbi:MAG: hypothetical protein J2P41_01470 [Blastocatellia bacterium]|nr:hypothetical protein [Blastocatellia bacterium]
MYKFDLRFRKAALFLVAAILVSVPQLIPPQVIAQDQRSQKTQTEQTELLPGNPVGEWHAINRTRTLKSDEWSVLPAAAIYEEYGLQRLHSRVYAKGGDKATVEIFEMLFPSGAYGLYTFDQGSLSPHRREFYQGNYLISIDSGLKDDEFDAAIAEILKKGAAMNSGRLPSLPSHLPERNKIAGTEKYLVGPAALAQLKGFSGLKDVVKFAGGVEIASADYHNGDGTMGLMIIEYQTTQTAGDGLKALTKYLDSQVDKENRLLKRVGNYLVYAINVKDSTDAGNLISQVKYDYRIYWEGRRMSDVPLEFRAPDPAVIGEANKTLMIMVRSFYWVGALMSGSILIGLLAGGTFFYLRRYRRRKLGLDDLFSDAGGTVRLNLDNFLLKPPDQSSVKQIGDGNA